MTDKTIYYYTYLTSYGPVSLIPHERGYQVVLAHERLGEYTSFNDTFAAVVTGQTKNAFSGGDLAALDIPGDLDEWNKKVFAVIKRLRPA